jgi:hypothetical protein
MISAWSYIISMSLYIAILVLVTEITRKSPEFGFILTIGLIILLFFSKNIDGWFRWAKDLSVLIPMFIVGLGRLSSKKQWSGKVGKFWRSNYVKAFTCIILCLNIFEASLKGYQLGNHANGLCGFIMILCVPFAISKYWKFDHEDKDVLACDLSLAWCFIYMTWNACFVYGESHAFFASSCCIIIIPEVYNIISVKKGKANLWIHARIYTLMFHLSVRSFYDVCTPFMNSESWFNVDVWKVWGYVNFVLMAAYAVYWFYHLYRENKKVQPAVAAA